MHEIIRYFTSMFYVRRVDLSKLLFAFDGKESARRSRKSQRIKIEEPEYKCKKEMQMQTNHSRHEHCNVSE